MKIYQTKKNQIILVGDIHGKFKDFEYEAHDRRKITDSLLIQLGDFGVGFKNIDYYTEEFEQLNDKLKCYNNDLIVIRGNHDDKEYFNGKEIFSNLLLVPDYTLIETYLGNIICIGGATSIDKEHRIEGVSWWKNEIPVYDEGKLIELENTPIKFVVAHSNPHFCYPTSKIPLPFNVGDCIIDDIKLERETITQIYNHLIKDHYIMKWYNGHYHYRMSEDIKGTKFVTLDVLEFIELIK